MGGVFFLFPFFKWCSCWGTFFFFFFFLSRLCLLTCKYKYNTIQMATRTNTIPTQVGKEFRMTYFKIFAKAGKTDTYQWITQCWQTYVFFLFCRTWTMRNLITSQTRVKRVSRIHHRTILHWGWTTIEDGPVVYPANAFDSRLRGD